MPKYSESAIYQRIHRKELNKIIEDNIPTDETIYVALKGAHKEYLICTEKQVYIVKSGFMTRRLFGTGLFSMPYSNITNVQVDFGVISGYFEVSAGGIENTDKSYWSTSGKSSASQQPNSISILDKENKLMFDEASQFIIKMINGDSLPGGEVEILATSEADELLKFKHLLDEGIITQDEFDKKKDDIFRM